MSDRPLMLQTRLAVAGGGLVFLIAGAGWALAGPQIFIEAVIAGIAGCF